MLKDIESEVNALGNYIESVSIQNEFAAAEEAILRIDQLVGSAQLSQASEEKRKNALATYWYERGDFSHARHLTQSLRETISSSESPPFPHRYAWYSYMHALCIYKMGDADIAKEMFGEAIQAAIHTQYIRGQIFPRIQLATIALDENQDAEAERCLNEGHGLAVQSGDRRLLAPIYRCYARLHTLRGDLPAAYAALTEAIDLFERMGMRRELAEAHEELAHLEAQMAEESREPRTEN
jgi:tetratricopeptide (TPR) repeat protein